MKTYLRPPTVALVVLACGVAATLLAWFFVGGQARYDAQLEFAGKANLAANVLERRFQRYVDVLYGLEALAYHDERLSRPEFHHYVSTLELGRRFPGVKAVELIRRVPGAGRDRFVEEIRRDASLSPAGYPAFDIFPGGARDEYWVIDFIEPLKGNEAVFGLDIRTREPALEAAGRARDTGEPVATGRYQLAQETSGSYGLVMYLPV
jgi:CHASE1-domain containing sensor protein